MAGAFFAAGFLAAAFLAGAFFAAGFSASSCALAARAAALAAFSSSARAFPGQSMFTQMRQGPRVVVTCTMGAPQSGHTSPVAASSPRWGSG